MSILSGKIYKISIGGMTYYGSTVKPLHVRFIRHKTSYNRWKAGHKVSNCKSFEIFDKYGIYEPKIELVENYPCYSKKELRIREQYYFDTMECINVTKAYCTEEEKIETKLRNNLKAKERVVCVCGREVCRGQLQNHLLTKLHHKSLIANNPLFSINL